MTVQSNTTDELLGSQDIPDRLIKVNKEYARSFDEHKKNQEIKRLQEKYGKSYRDGSDTDSVEDEFADMYTEEQEDAFANILWNIRNHTTQLQDDAITWWPKDSADTALPTKEETPETLKTQLTNTLLEDKSSEVYEEPATKSGSNMQKRKTFIEDADQGGLSKSSFLKTVDKFTEPSEDLLVAVGTIEPTQPNNSIKPRDFMLKKESSQEGRRKKSRAFQEVFSHNSLDTSDDHEFLKSYFRQQGWNNSIIDDVAEYSPPTEQIKSVHAEETSIAAGAEIEKQDAPSEIDSTSMRPHPRSTQVDTIRERNNRRTESRKLKQEKHEEQRRIQQEEVGRLKSLQTESLNRRINVISKVSGSNKIKEIISDKFLTSDFDEKEWDKQMARLFSDDFYEGKGNPEDEDELEADDVDSWMFTGESEDKKDEISEIDPRLQGELKKLQTEIKQIHKDRSEQDTKPVHRFRYANVPTDDLALSTDDILLFDDRKLNEIAPLRWYAPYVTEKERRKFKYMSLAKRKDMRNRRSDDNSGFSKSKKYRQNSSNAN